MLFQPKSPVFDLSGRQFDAWRPWVWHSDTRGCYDNQSTAAMDDGPGGLGAMTWGPLDHLQSEICQSRTTDRGLFSIGIVLF